MSWAHPEFGAVIASSSYDRTVKVWEQVAPFGQPEPTTNGTTNSSQPSSGPSNSRWVERTVLTDARGTVRAVEFAPHHFGLKLVRPPSFNSSLVTYSTQATISSDNYLRIYECLEQPSLTTWQLAEEFDAQTVPSASNSPHSRTHTATVATPTQTTSTFDNTAVSLVSQALQQNVAATTTPAIAPTSASPAPPAAAYVRTGNREADGGWCISWCKDRYWGEMIAAGCGTSGTVKVKYLHSHPNPSSKSNFFHLLPGHSAFLPPVHLCPHPQPHSTRHPTTCFRRSCGWW